MKFRVGLSSYTYVWAVGIPGYPTLPEPMSAEDLLRKAAHEGVRVVQIGDNMPLDDFDDRRTGALRELADALELDIELGTGGIAPERLRRYLELARRLRAGVIRTLLDTRTHRPTPEEVVDTLRPLAAEFEAAGVALAIENHDRFRAAALVEMVGAIGSASVGICLDTANSLSCLETPQAVVEQLGPYAVNLHVKDFQYVRPPHLKGLVVEGRPCGQGQLDIPWLLRELDRGGRDMTAVVELWPPPEATLGESVAKEDRWARESVAYLRQFISD